MIFIANTIVMHLKKDVIKRSIRTIKTVIIAAFKLRRSCIDFAQRPWTLLQRIRENLVQRDQGKASNV